MRGCDEVWIYFVGSDVCVGDFCVGCYGGVIDC